MHFFLSDSALKDFGKRKGKWKNLPGRTYSSDAAAAAVEESQQQGSSLEEFTGCRSELVLLSLLGSTSCLPAESGDGQIKPEM